MESPYPLFVYGTLRPNLATPPQQQLLAGLAPAGPASIRGLLYDLGPYPALIVGPGIVHGDLLIVTDGRRLTALDAYEECGGEDPLYERRQTLATLPDGRTICAWAYYYCRPVVDAPLIGHGDYALHLGR